MFAPPMQNQTDSDILLFDDFTADELDRSKWNVRITGAIVNQEQQAYVDSSETIYITSDEQALGEYRGALILHPRYRPGFVTPEGNQFDFVSGRIDTREKFDIAYGSAAARIMLPAGVGVWPAFWMLGYDKWPQSGEIDVMEYVGDPDWVSAAAHGPGYFGEGGLVNKLYFPATDDATTWHVYAVDWSPDQLHFMVDGATIFRVTRPMIDFFGPWVFDNNKYLILNCALGGVYPFKTNGIREPYYGLPAATVDMLRKGQIRVAIDWVQVSRHRSPTAL